MYVCYGLKLITMKTHSKIIIGTLSFCLLGISPVVNAQDDHKKSSSVSEKVEITIENGETTVKLTEITDGKETVTILKGEEAERYMSEQHGNQAFASPNFDSLGNFDMSEMMEAMQDLLQNNMSEITMNLGDFAVDMEDFASHIEEWAKEFEQNFEEGNFHFSDSVNWDDVMMDMEINLDSLSRQFENEMDVQMFHNGKEIDVEEFLRQMEIDIDIDKDSKTGKTIIIIEEDKERNNDCGNDKKSKKKKRK